MRRRVSRRSGQVVPVAALLMIVLIGIVALALDGGRGYVDRRSLQAAADTAALSGATQLSLQSHGRGDFTYARAAALSQAVANLPGTSVPGGYHMSDAGAGGTLAADISGLSLQNGYTADVAATFTTVTVTLHHRLDLTFGTAAGFGPSITPGATATAQNGNLPFALILFRSNSTGSQEAGNLVASGSSVLLNIQVAAGAAAGTRGDALTNESICPAPGTVDFNNTGDMDAFVSTGWAKFPGGSCGGSSNVLRTRSGQTLVQYPQIPNPNYPEPAVVDTCGAACHTDVVVNVSGRYCLAPGTYSSLNVKKGTLVLMHGVYKVDNGTGSNIGFAVANGGAVATSDVLTSADTGISGCTAPPAAGSDTGVAIDMVPSTSDSLGAKNTLAVTSGASFSVHGSPKWKNISVYVENAANGNPCTWNAGQGCGSSVVIFQSGASYSVLGIVYGYGDNMTFGGQSGGSGLGQVFAWTMKINGNGSISETYDPSQLPNLQGLIN